jgi:hypothetical protein
VGIRPEIEEDRRRSFDMSVGKRFGAFDQRSGARETLLDRVWHYRQMASKNRNGLLRQQSAQVLLGE